jgi:hypothetical protein
MSRVTSTLVMPTYRKERIRDVHANIYSVTDPRQIDEVTPADENI